MHPLALLFVFSGKHLKASFPMHFLRNFPRRGDFITSPEADDLEILQVRWITPYTIDEDCTLELICKELV